MKIAVTADLHLTSRLRNPERYHALANILEQLISLKIEHLVIAGDLFDATCRDPGELEVFLKDPRYAGPSLYIIPGNHDPVISPGAFTLDAIHYLTRPQLVSLDGKMPFLFLPYQSGTSVGEGLASFPEHLPPGNWVLIAHGDYLAAAYPRNNYETEFYMPLSGRDIQLYQPKKVFLGHIHARLDTDVVHYTGSPCGLDPTETGLRSFLIFDTASGRMERVPVNTDVIYFQESLSVIPVPDEAAAIKDALTRRIAAWKLDDSQKGRVLLRVSLQGYSASREGLLSAIMEVIDQNHLRLQEPPDLSKVKLSSDVLRADIAAAVQQRILGLELPQGPDEVTRHELALAALNHIYKG